jgi:hypothetical protein
MIVLLGVLVLVVSTPAMSFIVSRSPLWINRARLIKPNIRHVAILSTEDDKKRNKNINNNSITPRNLDYSQW